jgi:hypothetical protein
MNHPRKTTSKRTKVQARQDDAAQSKAFIEKAREVGADEENSDADTVMRGLARTLPELHKDADR